MTKCLPKCLCNFAFHWQWMSVLCAPQPYQHLILLVFLTLAKMFLKGNSLSGSFTSCETWFSVSHFLNAFFVHLWTKYESESHSVLPNSLRPRGAPNVCPTSFAFASTFAVVVQSLSCVWIFSTPWVAARQAPCPLPNSRARANSCPSSRWCHPTISSSIVPFSSYLPSFKASWVSSSHQVTIILELQLQHKSFQCIFRIDFLYD